MQIGAQEWVRMMLLYAHLIIVVFALAQVLVADYRIVTGSFEKSALQHKAALLAKLLMGLWVSGLAIIYIDTGFAVELLFANSKLMVKLICVAVLSLNGLLIHYIAMPAIFSEKRISTNLILFTSALGGISSSHWLMAAFIGTSTPLGRFQFGELLAMYGLVTVGAVISSVALYKFQRGWIETLQRSDGNNVLEKRNEIDEEFGYVEDVIRPNRLMENKLKRFNKRYEVGKQRAA